MARNPFLQAPTYDPNRLFDTVIDHLELDSDAALARVLGAAATNLSRMRHHTISIGPGVLIRLHQETGLSITELRTLMGERRSKLRRGVLPEIERRRNVMCEENDQIADTDASALAPFVQPTPVQKVTRRQWQPHLRNPLFAILRKERTARSHAFWNVVMRRGGKSFAAQFYDRAYLNNTDSALAAAQAFRDAVMALLPPRYRRLPSSKRSSATCASGTANKRQERSPSPGSRGQPARPS